jgi:hypothetical protein
LTSSDGSESIEIALYGDALVLGEDMLASDKRRFALLNLPRELFNKAPGEAARRSKSERPALLKDGR